MRDRTKVQARGIFLTAFLAVGISFSAGLAGCGSSKPAQQPAEGPQRYHMEGRVVYVQTAKQQVTVDAGDIPGFMGDDDGILGERSEPAHSAVAGR